jgi:dTDP-glucose 4,6-dehydratase
MRVLVTGAAGFIGSHLVRFLLARECEVVAMDNFITGSRENLAGVADDARFSLVRHDVSQHIAIDGPLDWVLHFASPASPRDYLEFPIQTLKVGALGTHNSLGLAKAKRASFLLASTSEVYGDPLVHPQAETYWGNVNPVGPRGVYDEAKRFAEAITMAYHRTHGVDTRIVRIFNTYGPNMRTNDGRAIPAFITQALSGAPVTVYGDGSQTRSFQYIDDLVDGLWRLMGARGVHDPVNIGNPSEMTLVALARRILSLTGSTSSLVFEPLPVDDPKVRQPDITRARRLLGWTPRVDVDEGLRLTIAWFQQQIATTDREGSGRMIDDELRAILVCPACKGELQFEETRIICPACKKAYPIRDGIPVMLISEATPWTPGR